MFDLYAGKSSTHVESDPVPEQASTARGRLCALQLHDAEFLSTELKLHLVNSVKYAECPRWRRMSVHP